MMRLRTLVAESLYEELREPLRQFLSEVDSNIGLETSTKIENARDRLTVFAAQNSDGPDELFDDIYVLGRYVDFFGHYGHVWRLIADESFAASWSKLQDALDSLRIVRRFSNIDISGFEDQLVELEKTYPYNVFFSIGVLVEHFECSICGQDIDSFECQHRKGELYRGRRAVGIARNLVSLDHVGMVDQPQDRRCVVSYDDTGEQFMVVRFLSELLRERSLSISDFGFLSFSKRMKPNPDYKEMSRNARCYCGSGLKFKRCCIAKALIEGDHVDIICRPLPLERAVV